MRMDSWHAHSQTWIRLPKHARPVHRLCIDSALSMHIDRLKTSPDVHLAPCSRPGGPGRGRRPVRRGAAVYRGDICDYVGTKVNGCIVTLTLETGDALDQPDS